MDKNILKQLKTDYENLEIKPSANLWDQIESGLDSSSEMTQKPSFQWWKYAVVIAFLITIGSLFYFNQDKPLDNQKTIVTKCPVEDNFKPDEVIESTISNKEITEKPIFKKEDLVKNQNNFTSEKSIEKIQTPKNLALIEPEVKTNEVPKIAPEKLEIPVTQSLVVEKKKTSYISADDLLLGRELDKTREEASDSRQFGVLEASKLKIKRPHTLRIFGVKVFADSTSVK
ncbi:hypothetical protein [Chryseobacterium sp.]|uniref:hypothetical protein n=1 Tax=Chryseobacterium sp. TaxID=1871047 RepID=UPI0028A23E90|nr:hypothetical protein [Chryseobacterium sp.]